MDAKTHKINCIEDFERLIKYAEAVPSDFIIIDTETNSEVERKALLWGIGICFNDKRAFYIVWRDQQGQALWNTDQQKQISDWLLFICQKKKLLGHNFIYDTLVLEYNLGIDLSPHIHSDTILLKHTIDESPPFGLKDLSVRDLGPWADKAQLDLQNSVIANGGKWNADQKDMYLADTDILAEYCMWDVLLTYKLFKIYDKKLREEGLEKLFYEEEVMPLYQVTIDMKRKGFHIDVEYFKQLKESVETELLRIEDEIMEDIKDQIKPFLASVLDKEVPIKNAGNFPKALAEACNTPLPVTKEGKVTLAAKALAAQKEANPEDSAFYDWISDDSKPFPDISPDKVYKVRQDMLIEKLNNKALKEDKKPVRYAFNLNSSDHLSHYFFELKKFKPIGTSEKTGKPQVNAAFIDTITGSDEQAQKIIDFKKLQKLLGTYINGILSRQIDGVIYASLLQFGTSSGRYSCTNPNLQNLPRVKDEESNLSPLVLKFVNAIRKGFVAPKGYKIVDADYSQLEPCCFATMSGDEKLQNVFRKGLDLYSQVSIDTFKMTHLSANKKDDNYLKKVSPEFRAKAKVFVLAVPYGAEASRISQAMNCSFKEAEKIIADYLNAYPELKKYMYSCNISAKKQGYVKTKFNRIRHLPEARILFDKYGENLLNWKYAKSKGLLQERRTIKNLLNNAKNFPIQGLAGHIINRAMIEIRKEFIKQNLDAHIALMIHDQVICVAKEEIAEQVKNIMRDKMENTTKIAVPLVAEPQIADNLAESH
jgi:DNA polymerase I-like protein with 3'-5' exonuclease and polymerase domains